MTDQPVVFGHSRIFDCPPSAKLVAKTLEYEGDGTQSDPTESTLLPARNVRYALTRLKENAIVESRISIMDAGPRIYVLHLDGGGRTGADA